MPGTPAKSLPPEQCPRLRRLGGRNEMQDCSRFPALPGLLACASLGMIVRKGTASRWIVSVRGQKTRLFFKSGGNEARARHGSNLVAVTFVGVGPWRFVRMLLASESRTGDALPRAMPGDAVLQPVP